MISLASTAAPILTTLLLQTKNPVKMNIILLIMGVILFSMAYVLTSSLWFPLIMYLVFMGGILMMFMILSSILPNEKSEKSEKMVLLAAMFTGILTPTMSVKMTSSSCSSVKSLVSSSATMVFFFLVITSYFSVVILMQKFSSSPLRSVLCQKSN